LARADGGNFCSRCGLALARQPGATAPSRFEALLSRPYPWQGGLESRSALEGERKRVTVLFADLRGSLGAIEGVDPEEVQELLDAVVTAMMDAVHEYQGVVNQVMGDGIMALFGAPVAYEDHALRAACAALACNRPSIICTTRPG
jgi:class 3 adenylate cyclase